MDAFPPGANLQPINLGTFEPSGTGYSVYVPDRAVASMPWRHPLLVSGII